MKGFDFAKMSFRWLLMVVMLFCSVKTWSAKIEAQYAITVDGVLRKYDLYVPDNVVQNCPVVIDIPMNGNGYGRIEDLNALANTEGFIVVYPFAVNGNWNNSGDMSDQAFSNDLHFLSKIIEKLKVVRDPNSSNPIYVNGNKLTTDKNRVYLLGNYDASELVFAAANYLSDTFAGFAAIAGFPMNTGHLRTAGKRPVPFMYVTPDTRLGSYSENLEKIILDQMIARNGCSYEGVKVSDTSSETVYSYNPIDNSYSTYPVRFVIQKNINNTWSCIQQDNLPSVIWNFLKNYSLPAESAYTNALVWRPDLANVTKGSGTIGGGDTPGAEDNTKDLAVGENAVVGGVYSLERTTAYKVTIETSWAQVSNNNNDVVLKMFDTNDSEITNCFYGNEWWSYSTIDAKLSSRIEIDFTSNVNRQVKFGLYTNTWTSSGSSKVAVEKVDLYKKLHDGSYQLIDAIKSSSARLRKAASATGESHGFMSTDEDVLVYGDKTGASNVYHALQLAAGKYTMTIKTDNPALTLDDVAVSTISSDENIIDADEVSVSNGVVTCSSVNPSSFDEYTLTISKTGSADFDVEDIAITGKVTEYDMTIFPDNNVEIEVVKDCDCYKGVEAVDMYYNPYEADNYLYRFYNQSAGKLAIHTHITNIGLNNMAVINFESVADDGVWEAIFATGTREELDAENYHFNRSNIKVYDVNTGTSKVVYSIPKGATELTVTLRVKEGRATASSNIRVASVQLYKVESPSNMTAVLYQFPFKDFVAGDNCSFTLERRTLVSESSPAESGWDFGSTGKDFSAYSYITVTAAQARTGNSKTVGVTITDVAGNSVSEIEGSALELSSSNPNVLIIPLKKVKAAGINLKKIKTFTFDLKANDSICIDNVIATTKEPVDMTAYNLSGKSHTKYGTICLPFDAAVAGAFVYNIYSVNPTSITISRLNGIMEAGKGYLYRPVEHTSPCVRETSDARHDVHFYQVTSRNIWTPIYNNGIMGTFSRIDRLDYGTYVLSSNKIYEVDSPVGLGANKAYFIFETKVTAPSTSGARIRILGEFDDEDDSEATGVNDVAEPSDVSIEAYYSLNGARLNIPQRGVNIVRMADGSYKKLILK